QTRTCSGTSSSGKRVVTSTERNVSGRCAIRSAPSTVLWSLIVTNRIPRARQTSYTRFGSVYDSPSRARRSAKLPLSVENRECACRSHEGLIPTACSAICGRETLFCRCFWSLVTMPSPVGDEIGLDSGLADDAGGAAAHDALDLIERRHRGVAGRRHRERAV